MIKPAKFGRAQVTVVSPARTQGRKMKTGIEARAEIDKEVESREIKAGNRGQE